MHPPRQVARPRVWLRGGLLAASLAAVLGLGPAGGVQPAAKELPPAQNLKVDVGRAKAVVESARKVPGGKAELKVELDTGSHTFEIQFESKDRGRELEADVKIELLELIEWRDVNGNGVYDPRRRGETVQRIRLGGLDPAFVVHEEAAEDGVRLVGVSSALEKYPDLLLTLTAFVRQDLVDGAPTAIGSDSAHVGIRIVGFPYQAEDTALAVRVKLKREVEEKVTGNARSATQLLATRSRRGDAGGSPITDQYRTFFGWGDTAMVDGRPIAVQTAFVKRDAKGDRRNASGKKLELKESSELYLVYPRGHVVFHDAS